MNPAMRCISAGLGNYPVALADNYSARTSVTASDDLITSLQAGLDGAMR